LIKCSENGIKRVQIARSRSAILCRWNSYCSINYIERQQLCNQLGSTFTGISRSSIEPWCCDIGSGSLWLTLQTKWNYSSVWSESFINRWTGLCPLYAGSWSPGTPVIHDSTPPLMYGAPARTSGGVHQYIPQSNPQYPIQIQSTSIQNLKFYLPFLSETTVPQDSAGVSCYFYQRPLWSHWIVLRVSLE